MQLKKFTFNTLIIELTRKCNMSPICPHCMRGNSQNIIIRKETIDTLLQQTVSIGKLMITGGEPTLCLDELDYIVEKLYEYKIPLYAFELTTNGLIYDDRFVDIVKKYSELITICRKKDFPNDVFPPFMEVNIQVSLDKYHSHSELAKSNFDKYIAVFPRIAQTTICTRGNFTKKCGNAKVNNIKAYKPFYATTDDLDSYQIGLIDLTHQTGCDEFPSFKLTYPYQVLLACPLELKCDGNIIRAEIGDLEYETMDNPKYQICNVNDDIYSAILKYNEGRIHCSAFRKKRESEQLLKTLIHIDDFMIAKELFEETEKARTPETYVFTNQSI